MSRRNPASLRGDHSGFTLKLGNMIRRVLAVSSSAGKWVIGGYETDGGIDGEDDDPVPAFLGFGIYAKPTEDTEAIVAHVGASSEHPVIVAVRDEGSRKAFVESCGDIEAGEVAIFNSDASSVVVLRKDGQILIKATGSVAVEAGADVSVVAGGNAVVEAAVNVDLKPGLFARVSDDPDTLLPLVDGVVHGTAVDTFTGVALWALGGSSAVLGAKK